MANYSKGKIAIPNVTGNIEINITAVESVPRQNLFEQTPQQILTEGGSLGVSDDIVAINGRISQKSGGNVVYYASEYLYLVTRFIVAKPGDQFRIRTDSDGADDYSWFVCGYSRSDNEPYVYTYVYARTGRGSGLWEIDGDNKGGILTIPNDDNWKDTEFIKLRLPYGDMNSITIYKE